MKLIRLALTLCLAKSAFAVVSSHYNHVWPIGEHKCRGPWMGSHRYMAIGHRIDKEKREFPDVKITQGQDHQYFPKYGGTQRIDGGDGRNIEKKINEICEKAKNEIFQRAMTQEIIITDIQPRHSFDNLKKFPSRDWAGFISGTKESYFDVNCYFHWHYDKKESFINHEFKDKEVYFWHPSDENQSPYFPLKTSFVFIDSHKFQSKHSQINSPEKKDYDKFVADFKEDEHGFLKPKSPSWDTHTSELRQLLTREDIPGVENPTRNKLWGANHEFMDAFCTTCDDLPMTTQEDVNRKIKCLEASAEVFGGLAKHLDIANSPLVLELYYELKELYRVHLKSFPPGKYKKANDFIDNNSHLTSRLYGPIR